MKARRLNRAKMTINAMKATAASVPITCVADQSGFRNAPAAAEFVHSIDY